MCGGVVMRVAQYAITEVDQCMEEAQRAENPLDFEGWCAELRPRAMQLLASRAARLTWSRERHRGRAPSQLEDGQPRETRTTSAYVPPDEARSFAIYAESFPDHHAT